MKQNIRDFTLNELKNMIKKMGEPGHRAGQIYMWLNKKYCDEFSLMTDLPVFFISRLKKNFIIEKLELEKRQISRDGTEKFLWGLSDGEYIETVLIKDKKRRTLCISTQVGCRVGCPFCASGKMRFRRDLSASEIVSQIIYVNKLSGERVNNVVFMGMGEPLDNIENLVKAIKIINSSEGLCIGARKITISTCGIIEGINRISDIGIQVELSISLHAAYDALRNELVPVNRKNPLNKLIDACRRYTEYTGRIITFEYLMIKGKNDSAKDAELFAKLAKKAGAKINLIVYNPFKGSDYKRPAENDVVGFRDILTAKGVTVTIRRSRGTDIMAACGQLAGDSGHGHRGSQRNRLQITD